jgi:hypothetical protein
VFFAIACLLSSTLSILGGIRKRGLQAIPNVAQNFHDVSVRPGHERNLLQPDFTAQRYQRGRARRVATGRCALTSGPPVSVGTLA